MKRDSYDIWFPEINVESVERFEAEINAFRTNVSAAITNFFSINPEFQLVGIGVMATDGEYDDSAPQIFVEVRYNRPETQLELLVQQQRDAATRIHNSSDYAAALVVDKIEKHNRRVTQQANPMEKP
jgi:hypothetical protein